MSIICFILILFGLYRIIVLIILTHRQSKFLKITSSKKYYIVLPVFKEEALIQDTLEYYKDVLEDYGNMSLIVVGTCNERNSEGENATLNLARKFEMEHIIILESNVQGGNMATQVNIAVNYIRDTLKENIEDTYFHLINIDSRVSRKSFDEILYSIEQGHHILLQSTLFVSNYNKLSSISKAIAIYQSRWTLVEEQYRILFHNNISTYKLYHVVGHGLIIRLQEYYTYKMLPDDTINEDLHFGFYLSVNGENVYPLTSYEYGDTPNTFWNWFKQTISWFYGNIEYYEYPKLYMKKFNQKFSLKLLFFTMQGFFNAIQWCLTSYCLWFLLLSYIMYDNLYGLIGFIIYYIHYYLFFYWLMKKYQNLKYQIVDLFSIILIPMVVSIPTTISILKYLGYKLGLFHFIKNKTQHE